MANSSSASEHSPEDFLLSQLGSNSVALGEYSETISDKWISLLKQNPIWEALLSQSPFKLSVQKVK